MWVPCHGRTFCGSRDICVCIVQHSDSSPPATASPLLSQDCVRRGDSIRGTEMNSVETSNHLEIPSPPWRKRITLPSPIWSVKCFLPAHKECLDGHNVKPKPHIGEPLASSGASTDILGEARSITTLLWSARGAVISWQPHHRTQAKDGMTLDWTREKRSVQHREGLKTKQVRAELELHGLRCLWQSLSPFIFITTPRGKSGHPSVVDVKVH